MIAAGGLSGGLSSTIAGGKFIDGFRQGVITSGLNHVAHSINLAIQEQASESELRRRLIDAEYNPDDDATPVQNSLIEFAKKILPELYKEAKNPEFEKVSLINNNPNQRGEAPMQYSSKSFKVVSIGKIKLADAAFKSYFDLASTMGHELNHVIDYVSGNWTQWAQKGGYQEAKHRSELKAYSWQNVNGGRARTFGKFF